MSPALDVLPQSNSFVTVAREYWQTYTVDNMADHRQPLCLKSNRTWPKGGVMGLYAQTADSAVGGNKQYDTDGILLSHQYKTPGQDSAYPTTMFQTFVEVRNNLVDHEYDWSLGCSWSGIELGYAASRDVSPPVMGYGVSVAGNTVIQADGLHGGAVSMSLGWWGGPDPSKWKIADSTLVFHNTLNSIAGSAPADLPPSYPQSCSDPYAREAIGINYPVTWRTVLYQNACNNDSILLNDAGTSTIRYCPSVQTTSCECNNQADVSVSGSATASSTAVGAPVTYSVQVANNGPTNATGVTLSVEPPAGVHIDSFSPSLGTCDANTNICSLGILTTGAQVTITVQGTRTAAGAWPTFFSVTHQEADPVVSNDGATVVVPAQ